VGLPHLRQLGVCSVPGSYRANSWAVNMHGLTSYPEEDCAIFRAFRLNGPFRSAVAMPLMGDAQQCVMARTPLVRSFRSRAAQAAGKRTSAEKSCLRSSEPPPLQSLARGSLKVASARRSSICCVQNGVSADYEFDRFATRENSSLIASPKSRGNTML
jgi:hypothetical protein